MENNFSFNEKNRSFYTGTTPAPNFDQLAFLTAAICKVPVTFLAIQEKTQFVLKARYGLDLETLPKEHCFTDIVLELGKDLFEVNYSEDPQLFEKTATVFRQKFKFYAGVLLKDQNGNILGVLNILDTKQRSLDEIQIKALKALAYQCTILFHFSKQSQQFQLVQSELKKKYQELEKFASLVSHDIKSPLANIISLTELLKEENKGNFDEETSQYLEYLVESSYSLRNYVDGILSFYRSEHILEKDYENVDLHQILNRVSRLYDVAEDVEIEYPQSTILHNVNKAALTQIFLNLISNGLKYNKKEQRKIWVQFDEDQEYYHFEVRDNGEGFAEEQAGQIFDLFKTLDTTDRNGNPGSGIGLATVKKLVQSLGGDIRVKSTPGEGSTFSFTIRKV